MNESDKFVVVISDLNGIKKVNQLVGNVTDMYFHIYGQGTADSQFQDLLGLADRKRICTVTLLTDQQRKNLFDQVSCQLDFKKKASGIAFSIGLDHERRNQMDQKSEYSMILAAMNEGFGYEAMESAKKAGATGGTIIKGSRTDKGERFLGICLHEEQELLLILAKRGAKGLIIEAFNQFFKRTPKSQGRLISLPVDDVVGLAERLDSNEE